MIKRQTVAPVGEVMTADDMRAFLRIDDETREETNVIERLLAAAREQVERDTGLLLRPQTWVVSRMYWPREPSLILPAAPATGVVRLSYTAGGEEHVISPEEYCLERVQERYARVYMLGEAWPQIRPDLRLEFPGLLCQFTCGFESAPEDLLEAVRSLAAYWYDNREAAIASTAYKAEVSVLPLRYQELIAGRRIWRR